MKHANDVLRASHYYIGCEKHARDVLHNDASAYAKIIWCHHLPASVGAPILHPLAGNSARAKYRKVNAMTTKTRTPKSTEAVVDSIVADVAAPSAPTAQDAPRFALTAKTPRGCDTKQGAKSGAGKNWHSAPTAHVAPNTRGRAYASLQDLGDTFTMADALAALKPVVAGTSGTPRSYWAAFVAAGYIVEA